MLSSDLRKKIRIAWFTPSKSNSESLSEIFSAQLLPILSKTLEIKIFTDSFEPYEEYATAHYLTAVQDHQINPFDLFIYQVENHNSSHFSRAHLGLIPGLVIFHHLNFIDYGAESFLNSPWSQVLPKLRNEIVDWPSRSNKYLPVGPFGYREAAYALQALFTNPQNLSEFNSCLVPDSISRQYRLEPQYLAFPVTIPNELSIIKSLQLASTAKPTIAERIPQLLKALQANADWKLNWLIEQSEREMAEALIREFAVESQVLLSFGRTIKNWGYILDSSPLAVHLLFSVYEQPCPYLTLSMAKSKVVIASDYGYLDYLPDNLIYKIKPGIGESEVVSELLKEFQNNPSLLISSDTSVFAEEHYSRNLVATELLHLIIRNSSSYQKFYADWQCFSTKAKEELLSEVANLMNQKLVNLPNKFYWNETLKLQFKELGWC